MLPVHDGSHGDFATLAFSPLLPDATRVFAQAELLRNGRELRTNSVPVIVRQLQVRYWAVMPPSTAIT